MLLDAAENLFLTARARVYGKSLEENGTNKFFIERDGSRCNVLGTFV